MIRPAPLISFRRGKLVRHADHLDGTPRYVLAGYALAGAVTALVWLCTLRLQLEAIAALAMLAAR